MRMRTFTALTAAMLVSLASMPASAKSAKDCMKDWRADKAAMQAAGKTEKAFVAECSGKAAKPSTAAAPKPKEKDGGSSY